MAESAQDPVVQTAQGALRGRIATSDRRGEYFSFQGIPYAQPPVGDLRFQPPAPPQPWRGVREALEEGATSPAPAAGLFSQMFPNFDEDSLFINVYTPLDAPGKSLPVLFWVHGGAFNQGSGNTAIYSPDYLITENVVVVTFNYRLGVLGFLSLATPECPGNFGLKDMVAALQWVQRNISAFGGDPKNVTLFGESAGGVSVQYLLMSKLASGLFHKAISQSGSALNPRSLQRNPRKVAFALGHVLGFQTEDDQKLLGFLKKVPAKVIVEMEEEVYKFLKLESSFRNLLLYTPVVEPDFEGAFISKTPEELLLSGDTADVPYILGVTTLEGLLALKPREPIKELKTNEELAELIPSDLKDKTNAEEQREIVTKIRNFYFPNGFDEKRLVDALSYSYIISGVNRTVDALSKQSQRKSHTYLYQFSYDGGRGLTKKLLGWADWKGTCHADELLYLFQSRFLPDKFDPDKPDGKEISAMTKLWTDFAKHGNPTPINGHWKPVANDCYPFLDIDSELTIKHNLKHDEMRFWNDLYKYDKN